MVELGTSVSPGDVVSERYEIERGIGRGGMATVWPMLLKRAESSANAAARQ